jgi:hypothetical protein
MPFDSTLQDRNGQKRFAPAFHESHSPLKHPKYVHVIGRIPGAEGSRVFTGRALIISPYRGAARARTRASGLVDRARHVNGCGSTQETRIQKSCDDVAGTIV